MKHVVIKSSKLLTSIMKIKKEQKTSSFYFENILRLESPHIQSTESGKVSCTTLTNQLLYAYLKISIFIFGIESVRRKRPRHEKKKIAILFVLSKVNRTNENVVIFP